MRYALRSILAATDLGSGSDAIVTSADRLAARLGAEFHLIHSLDFPWLSATDSKQRHSFQEKIQEAEERLRDQALRTAKESILPASQAVVIYVAHKAILERAEEVSADVIVVGPHRGGAASAHFLGTTADRVIRNAEVPCLVVAEPLTDRVRRIGVPLDCSDPSRGALETALAWAVQMEEGDDDNAPEIRVMHVGWTVEQVDDPSREVKVLRPQLERQVARAVSSISGAESLKVDIEVLWANEPTEPTVRWVNGNDIDLLVMGTHGSGGLKRALLGSMASSVARQTPCPVLLVPPSLWSGQAHAPALGRVMIATDFNESSIDAARWCTRDFAPDADYLLLHVLDVPEPPAVLAGRYGSREQLLQSAREGVGRRLEDLRASLTEELQTERLQKKSRTQLTQTEQFQTTKSRTKGSEAEQSQAEASAVRTEVGEGRPAEQIVSRAEAGDVDLIVMGGFGRGDRERGAWTMLGTTAERVLRASTVPVLIARELRAGPPRSVLVAVDGSEAARRALVWADFLRNRFDVSVRTLHVEPPGLYEYVDLIPTSAGSAIDTPREPGYENEWPGYEDKWPGYEDDWMLEREGWLREQVRRAGIDPNTVSVRVVTGKPAREILSEQARLGVDLIVMGSRGAGAIGRAVLGSVAGAVLRGASCSVLVVSQPGRSNV